MTMIEMGPPCRSGVWTWAQGSVREASRVRADVGKKNLGPHPEGVCVVSKSRTPTERSSLIDRARRNVSMRCQLTPAKNNGSAFQELALVDQGVFSVQHRLKNEKSNCPFCFLFQKKFAKNGPASKSCGPRQFLWSTLNVNSADKNN